MAWFDKVFPEWQMTSLAAASEREETRAWQGVKGRSRPCTAVTLYSASSETDILRNSNKGVSSSTPSEIKARESFWLLPCMDSRCWAHFGDIEQLYRPPHGAIWKSKREHVGAGWGSFLWSAICYRLSLTPSSQKSNLYYSFCVLFSRQGFLFHSCRRECFSLHASCCQLPSNNPPNFRQGLKSRCVLWQAAFRGLNASHQELNDLYSRISDACLKELRPAESRARLPSGPACRLLSGGAFGLFFQALQTLPRSDHCVRAGTGGDKRPEWSLWSSQIYGWAVPWESALVGEGLGPVKS